jgi:hypothetical protein
MVATGISRLNGAMDCYNFVTLLVAKIRDAQKPSPKNREIRDGGEFFPNNS